MAKRIAAPQELESLRRDLQKVRIDIGRLVVSLAAFAPERVRNFAGAATGALEAASERVRSLAGQAGEQGSAGTETAESTIKTYPWLSILFAALLGFSLVRVTPRD